MLLFASAVLLLLAGAGLAKKAPVLCALPSVLYTLFFVIWGIIAGRTLMETWNILSFVLSLAVSAISVLTVCNVIKTNLPMAVVSFAGALLPLFAIFTVRDTPGYPVYFTIGYGWVSMIPDISIMLRFLFMLLGTGFLALSLEYAEAPRKQTAGTPAVPAPQGGQPRQLNGMPSVLAERRSIALCIILSFVTFGFYLIYWKYTLCKKIRAWCGESEDCAGETACLVLVPFYSLYWMYTRGKKMFEASQARSFYMQDNSVVYLLLDIFGLGLISYGLIQNEFNKIADACNVQGGTDVFAPAMPQPKVQPAPAAVSSAEKSVEERLKEAQALLDKGLISPEEFEEKRRDILEKL